MPDKTPVTQDVQFPDSFIELYNGKTLRIEAEPQEWAAWVFKLKAEAWEEGHQQPGKVDVDGHTFTAVNPYL